MVDNQELDGGGKYRVPAEGEEEEDSAADVIRRTKEYGEQYEVEDDGKDAVILEESSDESEVWDCETIVSTYTNLDNHPGKIETPGATRKKKLAETVTAAFSSSTPIISLRGKAKLPLDFLPGGRKPADEKVKDPTIEKTEQYKRKQHGLESKEEKKERKVTVLLGLFILLSCVYYASYMNAIIINLFMNSPTAVSKNNIFMSPTKLITVLFLRLL